MKIAQPSVELVHSTPDPERVIERMGRICYQSSHKVKLCSGANRVACIGGRIACSDGKPSFELCEVCGGTGTDKESAVAFIEMIKKNGHESVLEHAYAGFSIVTDRGVTHEIVRHRLASYSQESTRYCNYGNDQFGQEITVIRPPGLDTVMEAQWMVAMEWSEQQYMNMLSAGCKAQIARSVLPNSLKSEIGMTANFREWRHFLRLRTSPKAHPQMREIAEMIREKLLIVSRVCFDDIPMEGSN